MKKLITILLIVCFMFVGCASSKKINGTQYDSMGLATMNNMDECVRYKLIFGNVF